MLLVVGGIHTGYESNTVLLLNELVAHYQGNPNAVVAGMTVILVPVANPDGLVRGRSVGGRFNANWVDLNRNWGCDWSAEAYWREETVNPGAEPLSEPETQALAAFIQTVQPGAVLFYHSAAHGIFAGDCAVGGADSEALAAVLGGATGYPFGEPFDRYPVTGTAANGVDGLGIPAVDVELSTTRATEFQTNLNGLRAVQCWLVGGC